MTSYDKYIIKDNSTIREALVALNKLSDDTLTLLVVDCEDRMVGTLTDGDLRRKLIDGISLSDPISLAMCKDFRFLDDGQIDVEAIRKLRELNITLLPCLDKNRHIIRVYDLKVRSSILPIDAVLMAGGKGERLRPLTEKIPKPLLKVGEKSIIDYNVERLISFGIENISVTVNYLKEQIEEHFNDFSSGIKIRCVSEPSYLGTFGAVQFVDNFQNDTVLVMNSDLFTNVNYEDFYLHHIQNNADMSVAAVPYSVNVPYGIFELDGRVVKGLCEKPTYNYFANGGIYLVNRNLLEQIPSNTLYNATDFMEHLIEKGYKVIRYPITGYWIDIGKIEDYKKAQELVKHL